MIKVLHQKPYVYARHIFPHDMNKHEWGAGSTISEQATQLGLHHVVAPKLSEEEGIEATRVLLPRMRIDAVKCRRGIQALRSYHYDEDGTEEGEKLVLKTKPKHDWSSHGCKALQYYATTPEGWGIVPAWARQLKDPNEHSDWMKQQLGLEKGGAATLSVPDDYDPLSSFRGAQRQQSAWKSPLP